MGKRCLEETNHPRDINSKLSKFCDENSIPKDLEDAEDLNQSLFTVINGQSSEEEKLNKIKKLIHRGADLNAQEKATSQTLLHITIQKRYKKIFKFLFNANAKMDILDQYRITAQELLNLPEHKVMLQLYDDLVVDLDDKKIRTISTKFVDGITYSYLDPATNKIVTVEKDISEIRERKNSLEEIVYETKFLMLLTNRAYLNNFKFRLVTELGALNTFKDLVFQYEIGIGTGIFYRYLQVKHTEDETRKITLSDLVDNDTSNEFSLLKYFEMFQKFNYKLQHNLGNNPMKEFVVSTNIDFDHLGHGLTLHEIDAKDPMLDFEESQTKKYKLLVDPNHQLYTHLRDNTEDRKLARLFLSKILSQSELTLEYDLLRKYHVALADKVIDINQGKFKNGFVEASNLEEDTKHFRQILKEEFFRLKKIRTPNDEVFYREVLKKAKVQVSQGFGKAYEITDLKLDNIKKLAQEITSAIKKGEKTKIVELPRSDDLSKLAGHMIVEKDNKLTFTFTFLEETPNLPDHLFTLRKEIWQGLMKNNIDFDSLANYEIRVRGGYDTCEEGQQLSKTKTLPRNLITDNEIKEFFGKLMFVVKQPSEVHLGAILEKEMQRRMNVNLLSPDIVERTFEQQLLEFFWEKSRQGNFLVKNDIRNWILSLDRRVRNSLLDGMLQAYQSKIRATGVRIAEVDSAIKKFIKGEGNSRVLYVKTNNRLLGSSMALQALEGVQNQGYLHDDDDVIFVREKTLLEQKESIVSMFQEENNYNLLIIEAATTESNSQEEIELSENIVKVVNENPRKRVLIVGESSCNLPEYMKPSTSGIFRKKKVDLSFSELSDQSQARILDEYIIFQGRKMGAKAILSKEDMNDGNIRRIVKGDAVIGKPLVENTEFQLPQILSRDIRFKTTVLKGNQQDVFALTNIDKYLVQSFVGSNQDIRYFGDHAGDTKVRYIIMESEASEYQFEQLKEIYSATNKFIHWLRYDEVSHSFLWQKSKGEVEGLSPYVIRPWYQPIYKSFIEENQLLSLNIDKGVSVISGPFASGKEQALNRLSLAVKNKSPETLVIRINLNDCIQSFDSEIEYRRSQGRPSFNPAEKTSVLSYFIKELLRKNEYFITSPLDAIIFKNLIKNGRFSILVDGYGDLNESFRAIVRDIFPGLKSYRPRHFIASTTPDFSSELEVNLKVASYRVEPMPESRQIEYLTGLLASNSEKSGSVDFPKVSREILSAVRKTADNPKITEMPVILNILANLFSDNVKQIANKGVLRLRSTDVYNLFSKFVNREFRNFYAETKGLVVPGVSGVQQIELERRQILDDYGQIGLMSSIESADLQKYQFKDAYKNVKRFKNKSKPLKRLNKVIDNKTNFVSRSMRHYFHAEYLINTMESVVTDTKLMTYFIRVVLRKPNIRNTRAFLDGYFSHTKIEHMAVLEHYGREFVKAWTYSKSSLTFEGLTIVHRAALEGHANIIKFISKSLEKYPDVHNSLIVEATTPDGATALHLAAKSPDVKTLDVLLSIVHSFEIFDKERRTPLHYAVEGEVIDNVALLLRKGANMHVVDKNNVSPLQASVIKGNLEIFREFLERHDWQLYNDYTLHLASRYGRDDIVKYLVENNLVNLNKRDDEGKTPTELAAENGHQTVEVYLKKHLLIHLCFPPKGKCLITIDDVNQIAVHPEDDIHNIQIDARKFWRKFYTLQSHDKRGQFLELLSELQDQGNWPEIIIGTDRKPILDKINRYKKYKKLTSSNELQLDNTGYTTLHGLAEFGELNEIPESLSHFLNSKDVYGNTPLHYAVDSANQQAVETLVNKRAKVTEVNISGNTPLHFAGKTNDKNIIDYLISTGANKLAENANKENPIQWTAKYSSREVLEYILAAKGKKIDPNTLKPYVAQSGDMEKVHLVNTLSPITKNDVVMMTEAAKFGWHELVTFLIEKAVPISVEAIYNGARSGSQETLEKLFVTPPENIKYGELLANAVASGNVELVKWVRDKGGVTFRENYGPGRNVLYAALEAGQVKMADWIVDNYGNEVDLLHVDDFGENLAHAAAQSESLDTLRWIVKKNVDIYALSKNSKSTLHSAIESGNVVGAEWLSKRNVAFTYDADAKSPFDYARLRENPEMVNWLMYVNSAGEGEDPIKYVTKEEWNSFAKYPVDDLEKIEIDGAKLADALDGTRDLNKKLGMLQIAIKYGNREELSKSGRIRRYFARQDVKDNLERLGKISDGLNYVITGKNIVGKLINGDAKGVAISSATLGATYVQAKLSKWMIKKGTRLIERGRLISGYGLRAAAPFVGRATTALVIVDLVNQVQSLQEGNKDAIVGVVGDSAILIIDTTMIGIELAETFGLISGVSSVLGPFAVTLDVAIFIGMDIYNAVRTVQKIEEDIPLGGWERFSSGFLAFIGADPPKYIRDLQQEEQANTKLVEKGVHYLHNTTTLGRYVFASAKLVDDKITYHPDNTFDFTHKRSDIKWSRVRPKEVEDGKNFCMPLGDYIEPSSPTYECYNTIGVELEKKSGGNFSTFIDLGDGYDRGSGFLEQPNIFVMSDGQKSVVGGNKDDIFFIGKKFISGWIGGGNGSNTLDFSAYNGNDIVELDPLRHLTTERNTLSVTSFQKIVGRKGKTDIFLVDCGVEFIDGKGGLNPAHPDSIFIGDTHYQCEHNLILNVAPNTNIKNEVYGDVVYNVLRGEGEVNLHFDYKSVGGNDKKSKIMANYTMAEIKYINREFVNSTLKASFVFDTPDSANLNLTLMLNNDNVLFSLKDNTLFTFNDTQIFVMHKSNNSASEVIDKYRNFVENHKLIFTAQAVDNEGVLKGTQNKAYIIMNYEDGKTHRHYDKEKDNIKVLPTEPTEVTHLISGNSANVYQVTVPNPLKFPLKIIYIYNYDDSFKGNTVYVQPLIQVIKKQLGWDVTLGCRPQGEDLIITLDGNRQNLLTIILKYGLRNNWYQKVDIIGKNAPIRILKLKNNYILDPLPLQINNATNYIVLTNDDLEMYSTVKVDKKATGYEFYKLNDDLVITNHFAVNVPVEDQFAISLVHFYRNNRSELHSLRFKFKDVQFFIGNKKDKTDAPENFREKLNAFAVDFKNFSSLTNSNDYIYKTNSASSIYSPINGFINWFKESTSKLTGYIADTMKPFYAKPTPIATQFLGTNSDKTTVESIPHFDSNQTLFLVDFLIRQYTKVKPYNSNEASTNYSKMQGMSLNIISEFENLINEVPDKLATIPETYDPVQLQIKIKKELMNGHKNSLVDLLMKEVEFKASHNNKIRKVIKTRIEKLVETFVTESFESSFGNEPGNSDIQMVVNDPTPNIKALDTGNVYLIDS